VDSFISVTSASSFR